MWPVSTSEFHIHSFQNQTLEVFCKKVVLKQFGNFTGKHLCCSLFLKKVFSYEIYEIFKNTHFKENLQTTASEFYYFMVFTFSVYLLNQSSRGVL